MPQAAKVYEKQLMDEINEDREEHDKKPFNGPKPPGEKEISESETDTESGVFRKGEHKKCFAYTAQTGCDKNGYVMDVTRYTPYRGLTQITNRVRLKFVAMNLKKYAVHRWNRTHLYTAFTRFSLFCFAEKFLSQSQLDFWGLSTD